MLLPVISSYFISIYIFGFIEYCHSIWFLITNIIFILILIFRVYKIFNKIKYSMINNNYNCEICNNDYQSKYHSISINKCIPICIIINILLNRSY